MYTKGCDTIYRVLEDVTETLSKTRRCAVHQSAEKLTGAYGCNVEHGLGKIDGRQQSGGVGPSVRRTARTKGLRARFGASKAALGKILRGKLVPGFGVQTRPRRKVKGAAPSWLEMLKSSLKEGTTAPTGDGGRVVKGPIVASAAQVSVHPARDRDQLSNIRPCDLAVTGVTGAVRATEQAGRMLAGGDINMPNGVILDKKDSRVPTVAH